MSNPVDNTRQVNGIKTINEPSVVLAVLPNARKFKEANMGIVTVSLLQRHLKIGYNLACDVRDVLSSEGNYLELTKEDTMNLRNMVISIIDDVRKDIRTLKFHLEEHNIMPDSSELMDVYKNKERILDDVQGILLRKQGQIRFDGDF